MKNINLPDYVMKLRKFQDKPEKDVYLYDINCNELENTSLITAKAVISEEKYLKLSKLSPDFIGAEVMQETLKEILSNEEQYKKIMNMIALQYAYRTKEEEYPELYLGKVNKTGDGEYFLEPNNENKNLYDQYVSRQVKKLPTISEITQVFLEDEDQQR